MRSVVVHKPGGHDALSLVESPDPAPGPGQYRVAVEAAGINYADVIVREGWYEAAKGLYPLAPGFEFAGVIDASGPGAEGFAPGERVFGFTRFGGYASMQLAEPGRLRRIPAGWSAAQACGLPAVQLTAYHALRHVAKVAPGETLLVHSAAGGVGLALLQQARLLGCRAVGVVGSAGKAALAKEFGADAVALRGKALWKELDAAAPGGFDAVFDANGLTTLRPGFARLRKGGRLVVYGFAELFPRGRRPGALGLAFNALRVPRFSPLEMTGTNRSVMGFNVVHLTDDPLLAKEGMDAIAAWAADGRLKPAPVAEFLAEKAADAHRALESGATTGKLALLF